MNKSVPMLFAFALGCFAAPLAGQYIVRPAGAAPEGVRKWEQYCSYQTVSHWPNKVDEYNEPLNQDLKQRGLEGWEIASTSPVLSNGYSMGVVYCLRRPMP